jgi:hypothetical protein
MRRGREKMGKCKKKERKRKEKEEWGDRKREN